MKTAELKEKYLYREKLWQAIRAETDSIFLAFSMGKDSLCAYIELAKWGGFRILPYYMYLVPGLEFVESEIKRFEDIFQTKIHQIPHPAMFRWLRNLSFQAPENCLIIEEIIDRNYEYEDIIDGLRKQLCAHNWWIADGVRCADSPMRRLAISKHGPITQKKLKFHAVWDYSVEEVRRVISESGIALPVDYRLFGRTFDGLDYRFLGPIIENFPDDYQRIKAFFPLVEAEIFRYEKMNMPIKKKNFFKG